MVVAGLAIPVLSALTQWLNVKLMPQASDASSNNDNSSMAASMKMMNNVMPIMSAVFCYTLPSGMGLYWIAGSVVRSVQQVLINKHIDKMDIDAQIKKNLEKRDAKLTQEQKEEAMRKATEYYNKNAAKPGSLASKANMVRDYNEKNNK